jgi:hypothetical protein
MTRVTAALAVLAFVVGGLALPAAALAQGDPFTPPRPLVPPSQPEPQPVPIAPGREAGDDGLDGGQKALIVLAGVAVLGGIAAAIIIDARRRRPVTEEDMRPGRATGANAGHDAEHRRADHRKRRAKAKTARESRKKNRPKRK